jgi:hypothetical protein
MKETQPQVLESTSQWPQKILALDPNLNWPLGNITSEQISMYIQGLHNHF